MQKNQNDINTFSIFDNNNEGKNLENIETNMEMEIEPEQENNDKKNLEEDNKEENPKKNSKEKRKVRGPNKCYRIIDQFFKDIKRAKELNDTEQQDQKNNKDQEEKKTRRRTKITNMSSVFDEYLNFVEPKVNNDYYNKFVLNIISNYKEFYIEKEKEFKENKSLFNNNIDDENLIRKKKIYGLENFLEIPEIVNDFMKYIYQQKIFKTDESIVEMIEIIFIFCVWLKQNHYTSYNVEYLINKEE